MKKLSIYSIAILGLGLLASCEKVVDIDLPAADPVPYVDAWINDREEAQTIKVLKAVGYLSQSGPEPIANAQVSITDLTLNQTYPFSYANGSYTYDPGPGNRIGVVGHEYKLSITYNGELFEATDVLNRVCPVDSITIEYKEEETGNDEGYYATFYAQDLPGAQDYYWIRTYRNGSLNHNVTEMWAIDGSFYEDVSDGMNFILPIREGITSGDHPYVQGDEVKVLIRSLSKPSYNFIRMVNDQLTNGGMFSRVLQNVPYNLKSNQAGSKNRIYGWFGTVAESELAKKVE
ncbi:MAG: DUF4249 domain-containing protein [Candidatus Pseudobacter hemicellulosilyticus]|uniref:DUF4249 domain-containing protein n=1 Tax=Candidatus Pseudobacter hemicellulosilyticus TaxID=3121375 RepID=A0AAJ6BI14_9BACT|nr:MAG: DUF4249 domain-containing protein [Pseudobacter sp.]